MYAKKSTFSTKILAGLVIIGIIFLANSILTSQQNVVQRTNNQNYITLPVSLPSVENFSVIKAPAVDNNGNGVVTLLKVEALRGSGRVLVDIKNLLFFVDTQSSMQTAKDVAENITHTNSSNVDLIYSIDTPASVIEGPSAGAALTIATVAALENKTLNPHVMITGTINEDGTIGQIGGVVAKAEAAKSVGATLFLVPTGQGMQTVVKPVTTCSFVGNLKYCQTIYQTENTNTQLVPGIEIREVGTIQEALKYFVS